MKKILLTFSILFMLVSCVPATNFEGGETLERVSGENGITGKWQVTSEISRLAKTYEFNQDGTMVYTFVNNSFQVYENGRYYLYGDKLKTVTKSILSGEEKENEYLYKADEEKLILLKL